MVSPRAAGVGFSARISGLSSNLSSGVAVERSRMKVWPSSET